MKIRAFARKSEMVARILTGRMLKHVYEKDVDAAGDIVKLYWVPEPVSWQSAFSNLETSKKSLPGLECENYLDRLSDAEKVPFVYENPEAPHLQKLRETFRFDALIAGAQGEYDAMLKLGTWLGSRWDHGKDPIPGGRADMDVVEVILEGMRGKKYWCEIAAKVAVQAFSAMGWPARLATASTDGYTWEHAVMETWSNQFSKWFALDTDFNVVYESEGVPLSAYELCHRGPALQREKKLHSRILGDLKPSLAMTDLIPFYAYVHIDMRSDWLTRKLKWGSPAGGDLATWWTARSDFPRLLTPKVRIHDRKIFDWPVNIAWVRLEKVEAADSGYRLQARLLAYAPYFAGFEVSVNDGAWEKIPGSELNLILNSGTHSLSARIIAPNGGRGMGNTIRLRLPK